MDILLKRHLSIEPTLYQDGIGAQAFCSYTPQDRTFVRLDDFEIVLKIMASTMMVKTEHEHYIPAQLVSHSETQTAFAKSDKLEVSRQFYDVMSSIDKSVDKNWFVEEAITALGSSAYSLSRYFRENEGGPPLGIQQHCVIRVNLETRRPEAIPASLREKIQSSARFIPAKPAVYSIKLDVPVNVPIFSRLLTIDETLIDENKHVAAVAYYWLLAKHVDDVLKEGLLVNHRHHRHVKEFGVVHEGEAMFGETVRMDVWEADKNTLHVTMLRRSEEKLAVARVVFHDIDSRFPHPKPVSSL